MHTRNLVFSFSEATMRVFTFISVLFLASILVEATESPLIPVGVAQIDITPNYPVRLSGFGFRRTESEGVTDTIWAKALAFGDDRDGPVILITADNLCIPDEVTKEIARRLQAKVALKPERLAITATHTHTGPMLKDVCPTLFGVPIPAEHQANIDRYTTEFIDKLEQVAVAAVRDIQPAHVSYGIGTVDFAMNRRTKGGPVDHDLPMLAVHAPDGELRAVYFSYACHCVTLSDNKISGDWAGFAQKAIEDLNPKVIALASVGCGADLNPSSRVTGVTGDSVEICKGQGRQIAAEVKRLLARKLTPITAAPIPQYSRVKIPFDTARTRTEWEERAKLQDAVGHHARVTLAKLDRGEVLPEAMDYPIQSWIFGSELVMVFLPGETVVDYSLRLKREFYKSRLWVNGYSNEGRCYLPSERILREGGYEGGGAMIYYDFPQRFAPGVEEKIISTVAAQIPLSFKAHPGTEGTRPLEPTDALGSFTTKPGLAVELVAAEPLVQDPVAIDWGPDGRLWVCEMHDYPSGTDNNWQPGGRVKFMEDHDRDGNYDSSVIFADHLPFPTGIMAWKNGVLICAAPDILFARDENGDGKADKIEKVFTGFATDNYQARVNSLTLGLDNWIYAANGLLGGTIRAERNSVLPMVRQSVDIRGHDFRFSPKTGVLEKVSGLTQQGRTRDDWGNWFGCDNTRLLLHFPRREHYLRRNPHVTLPNPIRPTTSGPDGNRLYPTSRLLDRFNDPDNANRVTSAGGVGIYRDTLLGEEYFDSAFTCEPVHNLVHREVLRGDLVFTSHRPADELESEFLSSSDNWFRPVQARTGPDGAIYVVDMYRFLIEHPRWVPAERLAQIDVRAGADRGRIYRVRKKGSELRAVRDLTSLDAAQIAAALDSPNGTERDRVHAATLTRGDKSAAPILSQLARTAKLPQVRLQALAALQGIDAVDAAVLRDALADEHPAVREHAIQFSEALIQTEPLSELMSTVLALKTDVSRRVVRQLAFTLGELTVPQAGEALVYIATNRLDDGEIRTAVLSSALPHCGFLYEAIAGSSGDAVAARSWLEPLVATAAGSKNETILARVVNSSLPSGEAPLNETQLTALATVLSAVSRDPELHRKLLGEGTPHEKRLLTVVNHAREVAIDSTASETMRLAAIRIIAAVEPSREDHEVFAAIARGSSATLRQAAFHAIRDRPLKNIAEQLLAKWDETSPSARAEILALFFERTEWSVALLEGVHSGKVPPNAISLADRQRLARSSDARVRKLVTEVLPEQGTATRTEALKKYHSSLSLGGDVSRGAKVFAEQCASCHALKGLGHEVGPDLGTLRNKEPEYWLQNILDPNAAIEPRFVTYHVDLTDGRDISGIIKNETSTGITVVAANGVSENVLRSRVRKLRASTLSIMPEGLEDLIQPQQMADLIAFVRDGASAKVVAGNKPAVIAADREGVYMLSADTAEIFGQQITYERQFQNIGLWHSAADYCAWTVQVTEEGTYDVYFDHACAAGAAGNQYRLASGLSELRGTVSSTGSDWSVYQQVKVGQLRLNSGAQRITLRADGEVRGALIDLRTIALAPSGRKPRWLGIATTQGEVLRDAPSVARFILDASKPDSARETAIKANPQFAASLVTEMTRDLTPGTPEEYIRIPWIWRVAIACGKRNDARQIHAVLAASLPKISEPLRDWQAVVIGGGVINGISERGVQPAARIREIIDDDSLLSQRWQRAIEQASVMADEARVPKGTRYDALRIIALGGWENRGPQLLRYLGKDVDAELQMGAVSGLVDMHVPPADHALIQAYPDLSDGNKRIVLDALVMRDAARGLLDAIEDGKFPRTDLTEKHRVALLAHRNSEIRERAKKLFEK